MFYSHHHIQTLIQFHHRSNVKPKIIKPLQENIGENLCVPGLSNYFLDMMTKT